MMKHRLTVDMSDPNVEIYILPKENHDEMCIINTKSEDFHELCLKYPKDTLKFNQVKEYEESI